MRSLSPYEVTLLQMKVASDLTCQLVACSTSRLVDLLCNFLHLKLEPHIRQFSENRQIPNIRLHSGDSRVNLTNIREN